ncbi:MAG: hypothetical protein RBS57_02595 [Desulforhabdus sp.]|jgi:hypothetical protein|nr:hypothetical protein [Desulforhabdus sp.]
MILNDRGNRGSVKTKFVLRKEDVPFNGMIAKEKKMQICFFDVWTKSVPNALEMEAIVIKLSTVWPEDAFSISQQLSSIAKNTR